MIKLELAVISIEIGTLETISTGLERNLVELEIGRRVETIETTALLRLARLLKRAQETCCLLDSSK